MGRGEGRETEEAPATPYSCSDSCLANSPLPPCCFAALISLPRLRLAVCLMLVDGPSIRSVGSEGRGCPAPRPGTAPSSTPARSSIQGTSPITRPAENAFRQALRHLLVPPRASPHLSTQAHTPPVTMSSKGQPGPALRMSQLLHSQDPPGLPGPMFPGIPAPPDFRPCPAHVVHPVMSRTRKPLASVWSGGCLGPSSAAT